MVSNDLQNMLKNNSSPQCTSWTHPKRKIVRAHARRSKHTYLCIMFILLSDLWYRHAVNCHRQAQDDAQTARPHASSLNATCVSVLEVSCYIGWGVDIFWSRCVEQLPSCVSDSRSFPCKDDRRRLLWYLSHPTKKIPKSRLHLWWHNVMPISKQPILKSNILGTNCINN